MADRRSPNGQHKVDGAVPTAKLDPVSAWQRRVIDRSLERATRRSINRGAELILAAAKLLERSGADSFTVQDVADAAKVSLRTLYVHFGGKDDLLLAVYEEAMEAKARILEAAVSEHDEPLERLVAALYLSTRLSERSAKGLNLGLSHVRTKLLMSAPAALASAQAPVTGLFARLLQDAADIGAVRVTELEPTVHIIMMVLYSSSMSVTLGNQFDLKMPDAVEIVEFLLGGLKTQLPQNWHAQFESAWRGMPQHFSVADHLRI